MTRIFSLAFIFVNKAKVKYNGGTLECSTIWALLAKSRLGRNHYSWNCNIEFPTVIDKSVS